MIEIKFISDNTSEVLSDIMRLGVLLQRGMAGPAVQGVTGEAPKAEPSDAKPTEDKAPDTRQAYASDTAIADIDGISGRSRNGLSAIGVDTLADLAKVTEDDMLGAKGVGKAAVDLLLELAADAGVEIGSDVPEPAEPAAAPAEEEKPEPSAATDLDKAISEATAPARPAAQPTESDVRAVMTRLMAFGPAAGKRFLEILNTLDAVDRKPGSAPVAKLALLRPEKYAEAVSLAEAAIAELEALA